MQLLELRSRALGLAGNDARRVVDQVFGILLRRALDGDKDLSILIRSSDPYGYEPTDSDDDRICIKHKPSKRSASVAQKRLKRGYVVAAYKAMAGVLPFGRPGCPAARVSDPVQLDSLIRDSHSLMGNADLAEVFEPEQRKLKPTRDTMNRLARELIRC